MGNGMICGIRRRRVEERLTRPQRLVRQPSNVDYKRLRKLILSHKLAPCFDAVEAEDLGCVTVDVEECPICFLYYPSLNRSKCCTKGICTECFLQMKPSVAAHPAQCPFCKTPCYAVEYRGARTEKEKCLEQVEEQKFIEAKIRMQSESDNVRQVMPMNQTRFHEVGNSISNLGGALVGLDDSRDARSPQMQESLEENGSSFSNTDSARHEEFAVDLEGIMMMEAIWQSLQDARLQEKIAHEVYGSSDTVQSEIGKQGSCKNRHCFSQDSSAECSILEHQIPRIEYHRSQSHRGPFVDSFEESDVTSSEANSFASSSNSINFASTLGRPLGSLLRVNGDAGQSSCHYTGLTIREQPFMLDTESKA